MSIDNEDSIMNRKRLISSAEKKHQIILDRRNEYIKEAKAAEEERDRLNKAKAEKMNEIDSITASKQALRKDFYGHVEKRNNFRAIAKAAIEKRRAIKSNAEPGFGKSLSELSVYIDELKMKQQTTSMSIEEENRLIDEIRKRTAEKAEMEGKATLQNQISGEIEELNKTISENLGKADAEQKEILRLRELLKAEDEKMKVLVEGISALAIESNKKHQEYIYYVKKIREESEKAREMRDKILTLRRGKADEKYATKKEVDELNRYADDHLANDKEIEKKADSFLEELKRKGKINLG